MNAVLDALAEAEESGGWDVVEQLEVLGASRHALKMSVGNGDPLSAQEREYLMYACERARNVLREAVSDYGPDVDADPSPLNWTDGAAG